MPKYQVDILLAAWQDIDRISDFHLKMVGAASAEKITDHILDWRRKRNDRICPDGDQPLCHKGRNRYQRRCGDLRE